MNVAQLHVSVRVAYGFESICYRAAVEGNDMWAWHDVAENEEYIVIGTSHGTSFVRVTDPTAPEVLAIMRTQ